MHHLMNENRQFCRSRKSTSRLLSTMLYTLQPPRISLGRNHDSGGIECEVDHTPMRRISTSPKEPDHRHRRLLRSGGERPRGCSAAECGQQFPPSDGDCHTPLPREVRRERYHSTRVPSSRSRRAGQWRWLHSQKMNACHRCPRLRRPYRA